MDFFLQSPKVATWVNLPAMREIFDRFLRDENVQDLEWVWQTVIIAAWMKKTSSVMD